MSNITYETDANGNSVKVTTTDTGAVLREVDRPAPAPKRITSEAFWDRFTQAELVAFEVACQDVPTDTAANRNRQAKLRMFRRDVDNDRFVDLANPKRTNKVSGLLVTEGILTAPRASAITTDPIQPGEAA